MLIVYVIDLPTKTKCKDGISYFYKNQKYRRLEKEKKMYFSVISFQEFLIFHIWAFSENAECFVGVFL